MKRVNSPCGFFSFHVEFQNVPELRQHAGGVRAACQGCGGGQPKTAVVLDEKRRVIEKNVLDL